MVALADPAELVGAVLNRTWRLVRVIGQGGLGLVYEAEGVAGQGRRAVKLLQHEFCDETATVERFLAEAHAGARFDHPGIVKVYEATRAEDGSPYLVMELLQGRPLNQLMNQGRVPLDTALFVVRSLLDAITAAHEGGVIHRDLKPDNVFLVDDPSTAVGFRVSVLDLGLARVMDQAGGMKRKTKTGMMLGTPGYMSPEQIKDVKTSDLRSDLWSIAVIFYELVTGRPAFVAPTEFARMTAALTEPVQPLEQVAPEHVRLSAFFDRALEKEPTRRFQSAAEMRAALELAVSGQAPESQPLFPRTDTAISAGPALNAGTEIGPPSVHVVEVPRRVVPLWVVLILCSLFLVLGLVLGYVAGVGAS